MPLKIAIPDEVVTTDGLQQPVYTDKKRAYIDRLMSTRGSTSTITIPIVIDDLRSSVLKGGGNTGDLRTSASKGDAEVEENEEDVESILYRQLLSEEYSRLLAQSNTTTNAVDLLSNATVESTPLCPQNFTAVNITSNSTNGTEITSTECIESFSSLITTTGDENEDSKEKDKKSKKKSSSSDKNEDEGDDGARYRRNELTGEALINYLNNENCADDFRGEYILGGWVHPETDNYAILIYSCCGIFFCLFGLYVLSGVMFFGIGRMKSKNLNSSGALGGGNGGRKKEKVLELDMEETDDLDRTHSKPLALALLSSHHHKRNSIQKNPTSRQHHRHHHNMHHRTSGDHMTIPTFTKSHSMKIIKILKEFEKKIAQATSIYFGDGLHESLWVSSVTDEDLNIGGNSNSNDKQQLQNQHQSSGNKKSIVKKLIHNGPPSTAYLVTVVALIANAPLIWLNWLELFWNKEGRAYYKHSVAMPAIMGQLSANVFLGLGLAINMFRVRRGGTNSSKIGQESTHMDRKLLEKASIFLSPTWALSKMLRSGFSDFIAPSEQRSASCRRVEGRYLKAYYVSSIFSLFTCLWLVLIMYYFGHGEVTVWECLMFPFILLFFTMSMHACDRIALEEERNLLYSFISKHHSHLPDGDGSAKKDHNRETEDVRGPYDRDIYNSIDSNNQYQGGNRLYGSSNQYNNQNYYGTGGGRPYYENQYGGSGGKGQQQYSNQTGYDQQGNNQYGQQQYKGSGKKGGLSHSQPNMRGDEHQQRVHAQNQQNMSASYDAPPKKISFDIGRPSQASLSSGENDRKSKRLTREGSHSMEKPSPFENSPESRVFDEGEINNSFNFAQQDFEYQSNNDMKSSKQTSSYVVEEILDKAVAEINWGEDVESDFGTSSQQDDDSKNVEKGNSALLKKDVAISKDFLIEEEGEESSSVSEKESLSSLPYDSSQDENEDQGTSSYNLLARTIDNKLEDKLHANLAVLDHSGKENLQSLVDFWTENFSNDDDILEEDSSIAEDDVEINIDDLISEEDESDSEDIVEDNDRKDFYKTRSDRTYQSNRTGGNEVSKLVSINATKDKALSNSSDYVKRENKKVVKGATSSSAEPATESEVEEIDNATTTNKAGGGRLMEAFHSMGLLKRKKKEEDKSTAATNNAAGAAELEKKLRSKEKNNKDPMKQLLPVPPKPQTDAERSLEIERHIQYNICFSRFRYRHIAIQQITQCYPEFYSGRIEDRKLTDEDKQDQDLRLSMNSAGTGISRDNMTNDVTKYLNDSDGKRFSLLEHKQRNLHEEPLKAHTEVSFLARYIEVQTGANSDEKNLKQEIIISRRGRNLKRRVAIAFQTKDGPMCQAGVDYEATSGQCVFEPHENETKLTVTLLNANSSSAPPTAGGANWLESQTKHFVINLGQPQFADLDQDAIKKDFIQGANNQSITNHTCILGKYPELKVGVLTREPETATGMVRLGKSMLLVDASEETTKRVEVEVYRVDVGDPESMLRIGYTTVDGSYGLAGIDYVPVSGTLKFRANEFMKSIVVHLLPKPDSSDYISPEGTFDFRVELDNNIRPRSDGRNTYYEEEEDFNNDQGRDELATFLDFNGYRENKGINAIIAIRGKKPGMMNKWFSASNKQRTPMSIHERRESQKNFKSMYKNQIRRAFLLKGGHKSSERSTPGDWILHFTSVFWKVIFAVIAPPSHVLSYQRGFFLKASVCMGVFIMLTILIMIMSDLIHYLSCSGRQAIWLEERDRLNEEDRDRLKMGTFYGLDIFTTPFVSFFVLGLGMTIPDLVSYRALFTLNKNGGTNAFADPHAASVALLSCIGGNIVTTICVGVGFPWFCVAFYWNFIASDDRKLVRSWTYDRPDVIDSSTDFYIGQDQTTDLAYQFVCFMMFISIVLIYLQIQRKTTSEQSEFTSKDFCASRFSLMLILFISFVSVNFPGLKILGPFAKTLPLTMDSIYNSIFYWFGILLFTFGILTVLVSCCCPCSSFLSKRDSRDEEDEEPNPTELEFLSEVVDEQAHNYQYLQSLEKSGLSINGGKTSTEDGNKLKGALKHVTFSASTNANMLLKEIDEKNKRETDSDRNSNSNSDDDINKYEKKDIATFNKTMIRKGSRDTNSSGSSSRSSSRSSYDSDDSRRTKSYSSSKKKNKKSVEAPKKPVPSYYINLDKIEPTIKARKEDKTRSLLPPPSPTSHTNARHSLHGLISEFDSRSPSPSSRASMPSPIDFHKNITTQKRPETSKMDLLGYEVDDLKNANNDDTSSKDGVFELSGGSPHIHHAHMRETLESKSLPQKKMISRDAAFVTTYQNDKKLDAHKKHHKRNTRKKSTRASMRASMSGKSLLSGGPKIVDDGEPLAIDNYKQVNKTMKPDADGKVDYTNSPKLKSEAEMRDIAENIIHSVYKEDPTLFYVENPAKPAPPPIKIISASDKSGSPPQLKDLIKDKPPASRESEAASKSSPRSSPRGPQKSPRQSPSSNLAKAGKDQHPSAGKNPIINITPAASNTKGSKPGSLSPRPSPSGSPRIDITRSADVSSYRTGSNDKKGGHPNKKGGGSGRHSEGGHQGHGGSGKSKGDKAKLLLAKKGKGKGKNDARLSKSGKGGGSPQRTSKNNNKGVSKSSK